MKAKTKAAPVDDKPDVLSYLDAAKQPGKKKSTQLEYDGDPAAVELAAAWLVWNQREDEAKREKEMVRDQILQFVRPWHEEQCRARQAHTPTVNVPTKDEDAVRVSFQHRYGKIDADRETMLREAVGPEFPAFFRIAYALKLRKEIADDFQKLQEFIQILASVVGPQRFAAWFDVEKTIVPTHLLTERKPNLPAEVLSKLDAAGVEQVVALAKAA